MSNVLTARYRTARNDTAFCVLEGLHAIKHAIRFNAEIVTVHATADGNWRALAQSHGPDITPNLHGLVEVIDIPSFNDLAPKPPHTGIIAIARKPHFSLQGFWASPRLAPTIVLDHPAHSGNTGAVIRTAAAAGASAVLTIGPEDPWHPTTLRAAAGLHFALPVARIAQADLPELPLVGLDAGGEPLGTGSISNDSILVLGSERQGLNAAMRQRLSRMIAIPMQAQVSSLNLAASAAIILYHWRLATNC